MVFLGLTVDRDNATGQTRRSKKVYGMVTLGQKSSGFRKILTENVIVTTGNFRNPEDFEPKCDRGMRDLPDCSCGPRNVKIRTM